MAQPIRWLEADPSARRSEPLDIECHCVHAAGCRAQLHAQ